MSFILKWRSVFLFDKCAKTIIKLNQINVLTTFMILFVRVCYVHTYLSALTIYNTLNKSVPHLKFLKCLNNMYLLLQTSAKMLIKLCASD